jgi:pyruvate dehydrogenase E2 component (dihydrolipoamide acetyltransferase)
MATQVVMPKLSPTMEEGQLSRWLKKEGDKVSMGEPLAEIDTDKATMEMQALGSGVLRKILIQEGESAPLGQLIAVIGDENEDISALLSEAGSGKVAAETKENAGESVEATSDGTQQESAKVSAEGESAQAADKSEPPAGDTEGKPSDGAQQSGNGSKSAAQPAAEGGRLIVSPLAARMAAEAGINLHTLTGSGPGGRIVKRDIEEAMKSAPAAPAAAAPAQAGAVEARSQQPAQKSQIEGASPYRDEPMSEMRRTIARRLVTSIGPVPHFFLTTEVEMDRAAEARRQINEMNPDLKISLNDLIIKVAALSLIQHPQVNSSFQEKAVRYYERADIGVAVAIEEGLITPVIRAAESKGLGQIATEVRELAERARSRKLRPEEYTGATFSVSNLGMFGIDEFTAVINPPEAAILAVGAMTPKPVVRDGEIVIRQMMRVTMSCDHRVVDGATGARFLQTFKKMLENPLSMLV